MNAVADELSTLSVRLRSLRVAAKLTQAQLAVKADVSPSVVALIEQGKKADPQFSTLQKLAAALGVSVVDLLTPREPEP